MNGLERLLPALLGAPVPEGPAFGLREAGALLGGLGLFLYGLSRVRRGLEHSAGGTLRSSLSILARRPVAAALAGFVLTALVQSSGIVAVILVGMVDAGLLGFPPTIPVLLGADLGKTLTVQLIAFEVGDASLFAIAAGAALSLWGRKRLTRYIGDAVLGFGLVFFGMHLMKNAFASVPEPTSVQGLLSALRRWPLLSLAAGMVLAAALQSSAACLGVLLALAQGGAVGLEAAVPFVLGANIGSAAPGLIAAAGASRPEAKRVAAANALLKTFLALLLVPFLRQFTWLVEAVTSLTGGSTARAVANAHTIFNLGKLVLFMPAGRLVARLVDRLVPRRPAAAGAASLLRDLEGAGADAVLARVREEAARMTGLCARLFERAMVAIEGARIGDVDELRAADRELDSIHEGIVGALKRIASGGARPKASEEPGALLCLARDLEEIGDRISGRLAQSAEVGRRRALAFSVGDMIDIKRIQGEISRSFESVRRALEGEDPEGLEEIRERDAAVERRIRRAQKAHLERAAFGVREAEEGDRVFTNVLAELRQIHSLLAGMADVMTGPPTRGGSVE